MNCRIIAFLFAVTTLPACTYMDGPGGRYWHVDVPVESTRVEHKTVHITAPPGTTVVYGDSFQPYVVSAEDDSWGDWENFLRRHDDGRRGLIRTPTGQCLDIDQSNTRRRLITYPCHGRSNQQFAFDGKHIRVDGMCLDVAGENRNPGAEVIAYPCHGRANQTWYYDGRNIRNAMNGFCMDAGKDGNRIRMHRCDGTWGQQFGR